MQVNLFYKIGVLSILLGLCFISSTAQAFQYIDFDTYFPGIAQGHSQQIGNCSSFQLTMYSSAKINGTEGQLLDFCSNNEGEGLPNNSCDDGSGNYHLCDITGDNTTKLSLTPFEESNSTKDQTCASGKLTLNNKKYRDVIVRGSCEGNVPQHSGMTYITHLTLESTKITLSSGDYWIEDITMNGFAHIEFTGDARLFVKKELQLNNSAKITITNNASLTIVAYDDIRLNSDSSIEGYVYANGELALYSNSYITGRVSSEKLLMTSNSHINNVTEPTEQIDHFEFDHSGQGSTCDVSSVTLRACADESCSSLFTDGIDVTLDSSNLGGDGYWLDGNNITMHNGIANLFIGKPTQGNVTLGVVSSEPSTKPLSNTLCSINSQSLSNNNCSLTFKSAELTIVVPDKLANKPINATIKGCGNTFNGIKDIKVWSDYINPNASSIIGSPTVSVAENNTWKPIGKTESSATPVTLNFVNNEANLSLNYSDAGQLQLNVKYTLTQQQTIKGNDIFVSYPVGLSAYVSDINNSTTNSNCASEDPTCTIFAQAGEEFNLNVRAHAWESDSDLYIANNPTTPNYAQNMLLLDHQLIAPIASSGGKAGNLFTNKYDHIASPDSINRIKQSVSEVGVFDISVTPPDSYLGSTAYQIQPASTGSIGRFTPAYFSISAEQPSITDACDSYTYMGQTFEFDDLPTLEITPLSQTGGQLQNYNIGDWWLYRNGWNFRTYAAAPSGIEVIDTDSLSTLGHRSGLAKPGNVVKLSNKNQVQLQDAKLRYKKPFAPHAPTNDTITLALTADDLKDDDGICYKLNSAGACLNYNFPATPTHRQEWGRITMADSYGSELSPLESKITTESYIAGRFEKNNDSCTVLKPNYFTFDVGNDPAALPVGKGTTSANLPDTSVNNGLTSMTFSAPGNGNQGKVIPTLSLLELPWLQQDADRNDSFEDSIQAIIHFGIYRGNDRIIWSREQQN